LVKLSEKYTVPPDLALLYDFVNTLDERHYIEDGIAHAEGDEIARRACWIRGCASAAWCGEEHIRRRGSPGCAGIAENLARFPSECTGASFSSQEEARQLTAASRKFPLMLAVSNKEWSNSLRSPARVLWARCLGK